MTGTYEPLALKDALLLVDEDYVHAAHCLIYYKEQRESVTCHYLLMQMRFDGLLGFPGGMVDVKIQSAADILEALNRELKEEINVDSALSPVNLENHVSSHLRTAKGKEGRLVTHFFGLQVTESEFLRIEKNHMDAYHFPKESLGLFRVPVVDPQACRSVDRYKYYGNFIRNFSGHRFAGNARQQLLVALVSLKMLDTSTLTSSLASVL